MLESRPATVPRVSRLGVLQIIAVYLAQTIVAVMAWAKVLSTLGIPLSRERLWSPLDSVLAAFERFLPLDRLLWLCRLLAPVTVDRPLPAFDDVRLSRADAQPPLHHDG